MVWTVLTAYSICEYISTTTKTYDVPLFFKKELGKFTTGMKKKLNSRKRRHWTTAIYLNSILTKRFYYDK